MGEANITSNPYGFECNYFKPWELSADNYQNIHEEMFISPTCLNSKAKMGIYTAYLILFSLSGIVGIVILFLTWKSQQGWKLPRLVLICSIFGLLLRATCFALILANYRGVLRYLLYAVPVCSLMITSCLVIAQWFMIVSRLKVFLTNISTTKAVIRQLLYFLVLFNLLFSAGVIGLWLAAGIYRQSHHFTGDKRSYTIHNILIGSGFAWQGFCCLTFTATQILIGKRFLNILTNMLSEDKVSKIASKVVNFIKMTAFLSFNVSAGSFAAAFWMVGTLKSESGMSGFFYLLVFVFVVSELFIPFFLWWLVLRRPDFENTSNHSSDLKSESKTKSKKGTAIADYIIELDSSVSNDHL